LTAAKRTAFGGLAATVLTTSAFAQVADVAIQNDQISAEFSRGVADEQAGRYDLAIAELTRVLVAKPDDALAYEARGVAEDQKGFYDRAIADYTRAIALGAATAATYFNRGAAYEHRRTYRKALADYKAALAIDPGLQNAIDGVKRLGGGS
jgi:tetratricopeptide (TPR) repeat protein